MRILGLDLSLKSTGFANDLGSGTLNPPVGYEKDIKRLQWIRARVFDLIDDDSGDGITSTRKVDLVVIEGFSFSSHESFAREIGGLGYVIRVALADFGVPFVDVSPKSLKLFATGSGNAKKEDMLGAAIRQLNAQTNQPDEIDALWLFTMASTYYTGTARNEGQRRALAGVHWPNMGAKK
jgi:Holliday junction resolvasome RuvABC endonuclease subunit